MSTYALNIVPQNGGQIVPQKTIDTNVSNCNI